MIMTDTDYNFWLAVLAGGISWLVVYWIPTLPGDPYDDDEDLRP